MNDTLLAALSTKIEWLFNGLKKFEAKDLPQLMELRDALNRANELKEFELKMKYPNQFSEFEKKKKR